MERQLRTIFEQEPFGELERLITQTLVDVVKRVARAELRNEDWLGMVARFSARSYEEVRVKVLDFLDTASDQELGFLRTLAVGSKQPTALYYYRELQNLRDPLHFRGR